MSYVSVKRLRRQNFSLLFLVLMNNILKKCVVKIDFNLNVFSNRNQIQRANQTPNRNKKCVSLHRFKGDSAQREDPFIKNTCIVGISSRVAGGSTQ